MQDRDCAPALRVSVLFPVTSASGTIPQAPQASEIAQSWRDLRGDEDIQFAPVELPEQPEQAPPPDWLTDFFEWLAEVMAPVGQFLVAIWPIGKWVLLAMLAALVLFMVVRAVQGRDWKSGKPKRGGGYADWVPEQQAALALLEEADRLANAGRYDEATHLLLQRSVSQIAEARPDLIEPSSTAREIASQQALPEAARRAFGAIAERVERSLFALRQLTGDDWQVARDAYAEFALAQKHIAPKSMTA